MILELKVKEYFIEHVLNIKIKNTNKTYIYMPTFKIKKVLIDMNNINKPQNATR